MKKNLKAMSLVSLAALTLAQAPMVLAAEGSALEDSQIEAAGDLDDDEAIEDYIAQIEELANLSDEEKEELIQELREAEGDIERLKEILASAKKQDEDNQDSEEDASEESETFDDSDDSDDFSDQALEADQSNDEIIWSQEAGLFSTLQEAVEAGKAWVATQEDAETPGFNVYYKEPEQKYLLETTYVGMRGYIHSPKDAYSTIGIRDKSGDFHVYYFTYEDAEVIAQKELYNRDNAIYEDNAEYNDYIIEENEIGFDYRLIYTDASEPGNSADKDETPEDPADKEPNQDDEVTEDAPISEFYDFQTLDEAMEFVKIRIHSGKEENGEEVRIFIDYHPYTAEFVVSVREDNKGSLEILGSVVEDLEDYAGKYKTHQEAEEVAERRLHPILDHFSGIPNETPFNAYEVIELEDGTFTFELKKVDLSAGGDDDVKEDDEVTHDVGGNKDKEEEEKSEKVETHGIPNDVKQVMDDKLPEGEIFVDVIGYPGLKEVTYYADGTTSERVLEEPLTRVERVGTNKDLAKSEEKDGDKAEQVEVKKEEAKKEEKAKKDQAKLPETGEATGFAAIAAGALSLLAGLGFVKKRD